MEVGEDVVQGLNRLTELGRIRPVGNERVFEEQKGNVDVGGGEFSPGIVPEAEMSVVAVEREASSLEIVSPLCRL